MAKKEEVKTMPVSEVFMTKSNANSLAGVALCVAGLAFGFYTQDKDEAAAKLATEQATLKEVTSTTLVTVPASVFCGDTTGYVSLPDKINKVPCIKPAARAASSLQ